MRRWGRVDIEDEILYYATQIIRNQCIFALPLLSVRPSLDLFSLAHHCLALLSLILKSEMKYPVQPADSTFRIDRVESSQRLIRYSSLLPIVKITKHRYLNRDMRNNNHPIYLLPICSLFESIASTSQTTRAPVPTQPQ